MTCLLSAADRIELAEAAAQVAKCASDVISDIYYSSESLVVEKKADNSPVTIADIQAHQIIHDGLMALTPQWPILSEEEQFPDYAERMQWPCYWLVDPVDGTKEFIERTGEFTVNIALIEHGLPTIGVIYVPLEQSAYVGVVGQGGWLDSKGGRQPISVSQLKEGDSIRVISSRRHTGPILHECLVKLKQTFKDVKRIQMGSALKFCRLAQGSADIYPRFSPCCEWDTAAGQALLEACGGQLVNMQFGPLIYNQSESLINPHFYALGAQNLDWPSILAS
ncbi:MAG: 3'(2'),5'-bisphosphate nucleotidase CysQ [Spongiibacteraceae bacterium]|nr:3'(2'),5'-bisphosphate nucleotidase CysQ [Spongiibacteraceae bacterium]